MVLDLAVSAPSDKVCNLGPLVFKLGISFHDEDKQTFFVAKGSLLE